MDDNSSREFGPIFPCPDENLLRAYQLESDLFDSDARGLFEIHLRTCSVCRQVLACMERFSEIADEAWLDEARKEIIEFEIQYTADVRLRLNASPTAEELEHWFATDLVPLAAGGSWAQNEQGLPSKVENCPEIKVSWKTPPVIHLDATTNRVTLRAQVILNTPDESIAGRRLLMRILPNRNEESNYLELGVLIPPRGEGNSSEITFEIPMSPKTLSAPIPNSIKLYLGAPR